MEYNKSFEPGPPQGQPMMMPPQSAPPPYGQPPAHFQPPIIITAPQLQSLKSCGLIGIGVVQIILSAASIGLCAYIISHVNFVSFAIAGLVCSLFFLLMAVFSIHGGSNVWKNQCSISTAAALGTIGLLAAAAAIITNILAIVAWPEQCERVKVNIDLSGINVDTNTACYFAYGPIQIVLIILAALEALFGTIISCAACCNVCACCCCYKPPPSNAPIIQSPAPMMQFGLQNDQYSYSRLEV